MLFVGIDTTRDTVAGMIEDSTGSQFLSNLYQSGMTGVDIVAQLMATGGVSSVTSLAKGLGAVVKAFGDDFVRMFLKTYGDDAIRVLAVYGDDAAKLLASYGDDVGKALPSFSNKSLGVVGRNLVDDMVDDWYGVKSGSDDAAKDVATSWDDVADDALAAPANTGYNGSTPAKSSSAQNSSGHQASADSMTAPGVQKQSAHSARTALPQSTVQTTAGTAPVTLRSTVNTAAQTGNTAPQVGVINPQSVNRTVSAVNSTLSTPQAQQLTELYNKNVPRSQADIKAELEQLYAANVGTPQRQNVYNGTVQNGASGGMISNGQQIASPSFNQTVAQQQIASPSVGQTIAQQQITSPSVGQTATPQQSSKPQAPLNENGNRTDNTKPELDNAQTDQYNNGEEKNGTIPERIEDATERVGVAFSQGSKIPNEILKTKPSYAPVVNKWFENGGKITIENGVWKYTNSQGVTVVYSNGYPDFKQSGYVVQEVDIGGFADYYRDFKKADTLSGGRIDPINNVWHHLEDGLRLQEVNKKIHVQFTHKGGMSTIKK